MSTYKETCKQCGAHLIIDDGDCYAGGLRDYEIVFCPVCKAQLTPVHTSGVPHVSYDTTHENKV